MTGQNQPPETGSPDDAEPAEWMNVTPEDRSYPNAPNIFVGGWEPQPESDGSVSRSVRVWIGTEEPAEDQLYQITECATDESDIPESANYLIQAVLADSVQRERFATTLRMAHKHGKQEKQFAADFPTPLFGDRQREAVRAALNFDGVHINDPPGTPGIRVDDTRIEENKSGVGYHIHHEVAVEISGTLDLDKVFDGHGRLLYHKTGIEITLQGQRDNRCLLSLTETHV